MTPGSMQGMYLVVSDIEAARAELVARGAAVSEVFHEAFPGARFQDAGAERRLPGRTRAEHLPVVRLVQRPGRQRLGAPGDHDAAAGTLTVPAGDETYECEESTEMDVAELAKLLREAEEHHGPYEATAPKHHWSDWYAAYIVARQQGRTPGEASDDAARALEAARR